MTIQRRFLMLYQRWLNRRRMMVHVRKVA